MRLQYWYYVKFAASVMSADRLLEVGAEEFPADCPPKEREFCIGSYGDGGDVCRYWFPSEREALAFSEQFGQG